MNLKNNKSEYYSLSIPVTLLTIVVAHVLEIQNTIVLFIIPVVYFTYSEGYLSGIFSCIIAFVYTLFYFSSDEIPFTYSDENIYRIIISILVMALIVIIVGKLKNKSEKQDEKIKRASNNFMKILSGMDVQLMVTEPETDMVLFSNKKMNNAYDVNYTPIGQPCWKVYHGQDRRCSFCPLEDLYKNPDSPIEWEQYNERTGRWFQNRESLIEWTDGRMVHLQQSYDITTRKQLQSEFLAAKEIAEGSNKAKSEFLSRMSHEIRTPLNAIIGMTEIACKSDNMAKIRRCLSNIDDASMHLLGVINDILDVSKIEAGKFELSYSDFTLEYMLGRITNLHNFRFEQKNQKFEIVIGPGVPPAIISDQQRLLQVIMNLLSNAKKFTPNNGSITLSILQQGTEEEYATIRFEVKDSGIGITEEQQARLFRPFEQADGSITRRFGGTGLGLAISKAIVMAMGGSIWVESAPGKGTTFIFTIRAKQGTASRSSQLSPNIDWSKIQLLVVNPTEYTLRFFVSTVESIGIHFDIAANYKDALQLLRVTNYQIIFMDADAFDEDGLDACKQIRREFPGQCIVALLSDGAGTDVEVNTGDMNINYCLTKPLIPSPFIDCINDCLGQPTTKLEQIAPKASSDSDIFLGRRLLLVEDTDVNREIVKAMLEQTGVEIIEAQNGQEACELFESNPSDFDMIFMDIHMPVMDGFTAAKTIREKTHIPEAEGIPIIAMTANVFREDIEQCLEAGMNGHVGKPINAAAMTALMKMHLPVREMLGGRPR